MKILLNISNHPSDKWSEKQKDGWDIIKDIEFPNINPYASTDEIVSDANHMAWTLPAIIENNLPKNRIVANDEYYIMLQGEFTFCYLLRDLIKDDYTFVIPTTERKTIETANGDGTVSKISVFEFVQWRKI